MNKGQCWFQTELIEPKQKTFTLTGESEGKDYSLIDNDEEIVIELN